MSLWDCRDETPELTAVDNKRLSFCNSGNLRSEIKLLTGQWFLWSFQKSLFPVPVWLLTVCSTSTFLDLSCVFLCSASVVTGPSSCVLLDQHLCLVKTPDILEWGAIFTQHDFISIYLKYLQRSSFLSQAYVEDAGVHTDCERGTLFGSS